MANYCRLGEYIAVNDGSRKVVHKWTQNIGYLTLRGLQTNNLESSRKVIAVHGFLDNANSLIGLASAFPHHHFIAIDLPGHGASDHRPSGSHYNLLDFVQDIHALVDTSSGSEIILLGHSLGGILSAITAAAFADKVNAVISIDAFGPLCEDESTTLSQLKEGVLSRSLKMKPAKASKADLELAAKARSKSTDLSVELCRFILARNISQPASGEGVWQSDARLRTRSLLRLTPKQAENIMRGISCPFLVIGASNSFKNLSKHFQQRKQWVKHAHFELLEGGHHIHLEEPSAVIAKIQAFVSEM